MQWARRSHRFWVGRSGHRRRRLLFESPTYRRVIERVAANVQRLRAARGWTQEDLAAHCGDLDLTVLRGVEAARTNVTAATVARLCEGLGVDVAEIYDPRATFARRPPGRPPRKRNVERIELELTYADPIAACEVAPGAHEVLRGEPDPAAPSKKRRRKPTA